MTSDNPSPRVEPLSEPRPRTWRAPRRAVGRPAVGPWGALALLFVISACSMGDRFVLAILAPAIAHDMRLNDFAVGLLVGPAIAILYSLMAFPLGRLADRVNRVRLLAACLAIWSVCTSLGGLAANAWQLALSRFGVAAAEGGGTPTSISLIADYFLPARRGLASAVHACATSVGMFLAFALGGLIAQAYGWRAALMSAGIPGLVLTLACVALLPEPQRGALDAQAAAALSPASALEVLRRLMAIRLYRRALVGAALIYVAPAAITAWGPTLLVRRFGVAPGLAGVHFGLGLAAIGAACTLASGWLVNRLGPGGFARSLRIIAAAELGGVVCLVVALFAPSADLAIAAMSCLYGFASLYLPAQLAIVQNYLPATMRATGAATASLVVVLVVQSCAPPLIGALSDALSPLVGRGALQLAMLCVAPAILLSALQYFRAAQDAAAPGGEGLDGGGGRLAKARISRCANAARLD